MQQHEEDKENPIHYVVSKAIDRLNKVNRDFSLKYKNRISPVAKPVWAYCSPVTELAANFDELSGLDGTPKRRLSLSSSGTPTPVRESIQQPKRLANQSNDISSNDTTPPLTVRPTHEESVSRNNVLRTIGSLPGLNESAMIVADVPSFHLGTPNLPFASRSVTSAWRRANSAGDCQSGSYACLPEGVQADGRDDCPERVQSARDHTSFMATVEDSLGSAQDSQDSGFGKMPSKDELRRAASESAISSRAVAARGSRYLYRRKADMGSSSPAFADTFDDAAVDNSPLLKSNLCGSLEDSETHSVDDGFHDAEETDGCFPLTDSLNRLLTAPLVQHQLRLNTNDALGYSEAAVVISVPSAGADSATQVAASSSQHKRSLFSRQMSVDSSMRYAASGTSPTEGACLAESSFEVRRRRFGSDENAKRCKPPGSSASTPASSKRRRSNALSDGSSAPCLPLGAAQVAGSCNEAALVVVNFPVPRPIQRTQSMYEHHSAAYRLTWGDSSSHLTGDLITPCCLPLIKGRHEDLKCISASTVASLVQDEYRHVVENFYVVDCRYPYEFDGGHIKGALNVYNRDDLVQTFLRTPLLPAFCDTVSDSKRTVIVFHCEFSSERGPKLSRHLRNEDRNSNNDRYPGLYYPELYLLEGGYKAFYEQFPELCEPQTYKPMLHPQHAHDLQMFRSKSKSAGANDEKLRRGGMRPGLRS